MMLIGSPENIASRSAVDLRRLGERQEKLHRLGHDAVLGIVERQVAEREREALEAAGVDGEEIAEMRIAERLAMGAKRFQRGYGGALHRLRSEPRRLARERLDARPVAAPRAHPSA